MGGAGGRVTAKDAVLPQSRWTEREAQDEWDNERPAERIRRRGELDQGRGVPVVCMQGTLRSLDQSPAQLGHAAQRTRESYMKPASTSIRAVPQSCSAGGSFVKVLQSASADKITPSPGAADQRM